MQFRVPSFICNVIFLLGLLIATTICGAQTTAQCSFKTFQPPSGYSSASPADINDNGTIVGAVVSPPMNGISFWRGLQRNPDGSMSTYAFPPATPKADFFTKINDSGVTVGYFGEEFFHGFVKSGNNAVRVDYPVGAIPNTYCTESTSGTPLSGHTIVSIMLGSSPAPLS